MTDLTKITTPFGLLNQKTRRALKAHQGEIEIYNTTGEWMLVPCPLFGPSNVYRAKPQPPKPRECWVRFDDCGSIQSHSIAPFDGSVLMREVLP